MLHSLRQLYKKLSSFLLVQEVPGLRYLPKAKLETVADALRTEQMRFHNLRMTGPYFHKYIRSWSFIVFILIATAMLIDNFIIYLIVSFLLVLALKLIHDYTQFHKEYKSLIQQDMAEKGIDRPFPEGEQKDIELTVPDITASNILLQGPLPGIPSDSIILKDSDKSAKVTIKTVYPYNQEAGSLDAPLIRLDNSSPLYWDIEFNNAREYNHDFV